MKETFMTDTRSIMDRTYAWAEAYAAKNGYKLNPDAEMLQLVIGGLAKNTEETGKRYCPCRIVTGDPEHDRKIICPCAYHHEEIKENGSCHCSLFFGP